MTIEQIEAFLAVIECGTISRGAEKLFVTQSTVSGRIQSLEAELGMKLIYRQKGVRGIELTPQGKSFIPIAKQWEALWKDTTTLKSAEFFETLTIACVDAVNNFTLVPLYEKYIEEYPTTKLKIQTHHSNEIYDLVERRFVDIGITFSPSNYSDVITKPIYRELMYLICCGESKYHHGYNPLQLSVENEIFLSWGQDYQRWHDSYWSQDVEKRVTVNTGASLIHYLHYPESWAIAPMSVIQAFKKMDKGRNLNYYKLSDPPPPRIGYLLTHRYPRPGQEEIIRIFEEELNNFVITNKDICLYEEWMLDEELRYPEVLE